MPENTEPKKDAVEVKEDELTPEAIAEMSNGKGEDEADG